MFKFFNTLQLNKISNEICVLLIILVAYSNTLMYNNKMGYYIITPPVIEQVQVPVKLSKNDMRQIECLAQNAYYEARGESVKGMIAVTNVVMNRTEDDSFPHTPCGVVHQKKHGGCQFSWTCDHHVQIEDRNSYEISKIIAKMVYLNKIEDLTNGATFYHAVYVKPYWSNIFEKTAKIGDHIFYKEI
jgi:spore germination cell wall hydrolase CwlJ-like protein